MVVGYKPKTHLEETLEKADRVTPLYRRNVAGLRLPTITQGIFANTPSTWLQKVRTVPASRKRPESIIVKAFDRQSDVPLKDAYAPKASWIFYPAKKDFPKFAKAAAFVAYGGPAMVFPGSVGAIHGAIFESEKESIVTLIQAHFREEHKVVDKKLGSAYNGWRIHLLRQFFSESNAKGCIRVVFPADKEDGPKIRDFKKVAVEYGYKFFVRKLRNRENNMGRFWVLIAQREPEPTRVQRITRKLKTVFRSKKNEGKGN